MGNFYNPPLPSQGNSNSTLPLPHDPIPAQGTSPPPLRQAALAVTMMAVLASWPADLEPRLQAPNNQQNKIAPLTLTYGQVPKPQPFLTNVELQLLVASWPPDAPLPPRGQQRAWMPSVITRVPGPPTGTIYPAILSTIQDDAAFDVELVATTVAAPDNPDQPPRQSSLSRVQRALIQQAWYPDVVAAQGPVESAAWNIPPIVSTYVPPPELPASIYAANQLPDPLPVQRVRSVVPTFPSVSQPIPIGPLPVQDLAQIVASWPVDVGPILPWPLATPTRIAPLTLPTGTAPIPQPPLSVLELTQIASTWAQSWDAQTGPKNAGWNVPPVLVTLPHVPPPSLIWTAWESPWIAPPAPVTIAPLTLTYGQPPAPQFPLSVSRLLRIVGSWVETWDAQAGPKSAGWNVPPLLTILPHAPLPVAIWTAWEPLPLSPPRPVVIAPLTLVYGSAPPVQPALSRTVAGIIVPAWPLDLEPRLGRPNAERTRIVPLTLVYGSTPPVRGPIGPVHGGVIVRLWQPPDLPPPPLVPFGQPFTGAISFGQVNSTGAVPINVEAYTVEPIAVSHTVERLT